MKFIITQIMVFFLLINIALAAGLSEEINPTLPPDLSNFPDMFIENGNFNAVIVVGNQAPASDVIAQSNLVQFFVGYTGKSLVGSTKLSSEIESLNQNIISIGSACHNNVSWEIMVQPKQCDRWLEHGKAMILLYGYKDYVYMVIAGYSDKGARDAVDVLVNYDKNTLKGSNMLIEVDEPTPEINDSSGEDKIVEEEEENITMELEKEKEKLVSELNEKITNKSEETSKNRTSPTINRTKEKMSSEQKEMIKLNQKEQKKEIGLIKRVISWFISLFK